MARGRVVEGSGVENEEEVISADYRVHLDDTSRNNFGAY